MLQNAWFQLDIRDDGLYIWLYPPDAEGLALTFFELNLYLVKHRITLKQAEKETLRRELENLTERREVKLKDAGMLPVDESMSVTISEDKLEAVVRIYAASTEGEQIEGKEGFAQMLTDAGVRFGLREDAIDEWLGNRVYCTDILVAKGIPMEPGVDASITYMFDTEKTFRPEVDENDNIDFHHLNMISHVAEGDVLAVLSPAVDGKNGTTVQGLEIASKKPIRMTLNGGSNTALSEDGNVLTATVSGHVELQRGKVVVNNIYQVRGNVGVGTGDIEYDGSVRVTGDVLAGYSVTASGDILVDGVVEAAFLTAGGQIVLANGMHGDVKGALKAEGNITAKFIQACTVESGGDVTSGSILHSKVTAKNSIVVSSKRGVVNGGEYKAGTLISVVTAGSPSKTNTQLEIGADISVLENFRSLEKVLVDKRLEQRKARQTFDIAARRMEGMDPLPPDKAEYMDSLQNQLSMLEVEVGELMIRYNQIKEELEGNEQGRVIVKGDVYEGTRIVISDVSYYVRQNTAQCQFLLAEGEVKPFVL